MHTSVTGIRAASVELLRRPSDVLLGTARLRAFASGYRKSLLRRRVSAESSAALASELTRSEQTCRTVAGRWTARRVSARQALYSCAAPSAAALFSPLFALLCEEAFGLSGIYRLLPAVVPVVGIALVFAAAAMRNGYICVDRRSGFTTVARGTVCRRVTRFADGETSAFFTVRAPYMRNAAHMLCVVGAGTAAYAEPDGNEPRYFSSVKPVMTVGGEDAHPTCGGCVAVGICAAVLGLRLWLGGELSARITAAAVLPVLLLLLLRARALADVSGDNAVRLFRDSLELRGAWGASVVTIRARRGEHTQMTVTQTPVQKMRGTCTLRLRTTGCRRAVRCRGLDYRRTLALVSRAAGR